MLVRSPRMGVSCGIKLGKHETPYEQCVVHDVHIHVYLIRAFISVS
jgi:hypothetical protein